MSGPRARLSFVLSALISGGCRDGTSDSPGGASGGTTTETTGDFSASGGNAATGSAASGTTTTGGTTATGTTAGSPASDAGAGTGGAAGGNASGDSGAEPPREYTRQACELVTGSEGPMGSLSLQVEVVVQGLEVPWEIAFLPNGDMLVTERPGRLRLIRSGQLVSTPVLDVDVAEIPFALFGYEGGLLGILLHPEFEANRLFYLYFTDRDPDGAIINRLGLYKMAADFSSAELERILIDDIPSGEHHQGGRMRIGPDGKLYVGVGAFDPGLAQQPDQLAGKLLRMNLDGSIPDDNPTPGSYVYLTGVRNTQGYDWFDAHHMLVMDHGPTSIDPGVPEKGWDEFNVVRAGDNLGWPDVRGCDTGSGIAEPVMVWQSSMPPGGATLYTGTAIPEWTGSFLIGTLGVSDEGQHLHRIQLSAGNPYVVEKHEVYLKNRYGRLRTVAMGPDGHLYVTTSNCDGRGTCPAGRDRILRIVGAN